MTDRSVSMSPAFELDDRFNIDPATNTVLEKATHDHFKLEPRQMDVLCMLAGQQGEVVTREALIAAIWNNYGGADDALSQCISHLRKVLGDNEKRLIRTIPKRGYQLSGTVSFNIPGGKETSFSIGTTKKPPFGLIAVIVLAIMMITLIYFVIEPDADAPVPRVPRTGSESIAPRPD